MLRDAPYILMEFEDISAEKRRRALERVFYHDILNTTSGFQVYLDLLRPEVSSEDGRKMVDTLSEISSSLVEEINSQRMLTSAENGTLEVEHTLVGVREMIEQVTARLAADAKRRGVEVAVHPLSEDGTIITDATILRRVLMNAVKNAVEASGRGDTVTVAMRPMNGSVEIAVRNPAYISEQVQHQIFNRFYSTKGANRGLGTYSMLLFTEAYLKGTISFESTERDGTTFLIDLPVDVRAQ
jgi:signal transduction histidine kinase